MAQIIDTANPSLAEINAAVLRTAQTTSSAQTTFRDATGADINNNTVLRTLKNMFCGTGPADENGVARSLPWNGCLGTASVVSALRAIGVPEMVIIGQGQTHGYSNTNMKSMKSRIGGVKESLAKVMQTMNREAAGQAAVAGVAVSVQQTAANVNQLAANIQASANNVQDAASNAAQDAYDRGYADGIAAEQARSVAANAGAIGNIIFTYIAKQLVKISDSETH